MKKESALERVVKRVKRFDYTKSATYKLIGLTTTVIGFLLYSVFTATNFALSTVDSYANSWFEPIPTTRDKITANKSGNPTTMPGRDSGRLPVETIIRNGDGVTRISELDGRFFVKFEPSASNHFRDQYDFDDYWTDPKSPEFSARDWCGECQNFHYPRKEYVSVTSD